MSRDPTASRHLGFRIGLLVVLVLAAWVRFTDFHWDGSLGIGEGGEREWQEHHLHPDERYLTMVTQAIRWPGAISDAFDTATSPLNPTNAGFGSFVYGTLPLFLVRGAAAVLHATDYDQIHLVGRALAALFDLSCVLAIWWAGRRLWGETTGLVGAAFVALSVLQIQNAHFFTVDPFVTALTTWAVAGSIANQRRLRWRYTIGTGILAGAALATKLSSVAVVPVALWALWMAPAVDRLGAGARRRVFHSIALLGLVVLTFRVGQPYAFSGPGPFDLSLDPAWLASVGEARSLLAGEIDTPPGHQWAGRWPLAFALWNLFAVGMGPPLALLALSGWLQAGSAWWRGDRRPLIPWVFVTLLVLHLGSGWVASLRYLLPAYPWLALLAARSCVSFVGALRRRRPAPLPLAVGTALLILAIPTWTWWFLSIYIGDHPRVAASRWIYENVPPGSKIAVEHWDDPLPLKLDAARQPDRFRRVQMPLYDADTPQKLAWLLGVLETSNYIVLASNRLIESIPRLPMRYPMTTRYYEALVDGDLGYDLIHEVRGSPRRLGIEFDLPAVEEAFSVYDHPHVRIFRRRADFDAAKAERRLTDGVDFGAVVPLPARHAEAYRDSLLDDRERDRQRRGGTWSRERGGIFPESSHSPAVTILRWVLVVELIGWLAWPWLLALPLRWEDRGFLLARPLGVLAVSWISWLLVGGNWLSFGGDSLRLVIGALVPPSVFLAWRHRRRLVELWDRRRGLLGLEFALFWGAFATLLLVRWFNPDLWHPLRGGEKPMELALLNAICRSEGFPPYDPWFAGGALNYYYFGYVLVAALVHLTGTLPEVAFNLALATCFAWTVAALFSAASGLGCGLREQRGEAPQSGLRYGLLGCVFVLTLGNLGTLRQLVRGWLDSVGPIAGPVPGAWFWSPSRAIASLAEEAPPITEFPAFSFLLGDLHAHLMALPFAIALLALVVAWVRSTREAPIGRWAVVGWMGLLVGFLASANSWDLPLALALVGLGLLARRPPGSCRDAIRIGAGICGVGGLAFLFYLPFHLRWARGYGGVSLWHGSRTQVGDFLTAHGLFLSIAILFLLVGRTPRERPALARMIRLIARPSTPLRTVRRRLGSRLGSPSQVDRLTLLGLGIVASLGTLVGFGYPVLALILAVTLLIAARCHRSLVPLEILFYGILGLGLALLAVPELFVLKNDIGRMNTVFKLGFEAWWLLGTASAVAVVEMLGRAARHRSRIPILLIGGLVGLGLLYPVLAVPDRLRDRFSGSASHGLDGLAYQMEATYDDPRGASIRLASDREAIRWLRRAVDGTPVIAESPHLEYGWGSRMSVGSGLPTVVGWIGHQRQQRLAVGFDLVGRRVDDLERLYRTSDLDEATRILERYAVELIVLGRLERISYPGPGLQKFERASPLWSLAFANADTRILRVNPKAVARRSRPLSPEPPAAPAVD